MFHELFTVFGAAGLESCKLLEKVFTIYLIAAPCIVKGKNVNLLSYMPTSQNHINKINLV